MNGDLLVETVTATAVLQLSGVRLRVEVTVPTGSVPLRDLLPTFHALAGAIVDRAEADEAASGRPISCRKGCGACCRQLVPIAEVEARQLRDLVESLPEPRRSAILARFAEAGDRLEAAGLRAGLLDRSRLAEGSARSLGLDYFQLGIACPFLEDESCSIHEGRPVACREYLVTTPAERCGSPTAETVRCVPLPAQAGSALRRLGTVGTGPGAPWVPLSLALEWAERNPDDPPPRPGPAWVGEFFGHLTGREIPPPPEVPGREVLTADS